MSRIGTGERLSKVRGNLVRRVLGRGGSPPKRSNLSFGLGLDVHELGRLLGGAKPESVRRARWRAITRLRELMAAER
jgi:hypothetical protein